MVNYCNSSWFELFHSFTGDLNSIHEKLFRHAKQVEVPSTLNSKTELQILQNGKGGHFDDCPLTR